MHKPTHSHSHSRHHHPAPTTHHQGGFGVKRKAHGACGLGGPPPSPGFPNNQQPQPVLQPVLSQGLAVPLRPNTCSAEGIGPCKGKGRAEEAPSLLPHLLWWEARPKILEACGAGACFVAFSTIGFAPSSVRLTRCSKFGVSTVSDLLLGTRWCTCAYWELRVGGEWTSQCRDSKSGQEWV
jgi:hypothetical protein